MLRISGCAQRSDGQNVFNAQSDGRWRDNYTKAVAAQGFGLLGPSSVTVRSNMPGCAAK
jgi:hypothetical protein